MFKVAFIAIFIKENITTSFQGASLILYNPEAVLLKLNIKLKTLTLPLAENYP